MVMQGLNLAAAAALLAATEMRPGTDYVFRAPDPAQEPPTPIEREIANIRRAIKRPRRADPAKKAKRKAQKRARAITRRQS